MAAARGATKTPMDKFMNKQTYTSRLILMPSLLAASLCLTDLRYGRGELVDNQVKPPQKFVHDEVVCAQALSPDGGLLATGTIYELTLWSTATGEKLSHAKNNPNASETCRAMVFSPKGDRIATIHEGRELGRPRRLAYIWPVKAPGELGNPKELALKDDIKIRWDRPFCTGNLCFSPDGNSLLFGDCGTKIRVWEAAAGKRLWDWPCGAAGCFSPDGKSLISVTGGGKVQRWRMNDGKALMQADSMPDDFIYVRGAAFSPDASIVAVTDGCTVCIKHTTSGKTIGRTRLRNGILSLAFSPNSKLLAVSEYQQGVRFLDASTGREVSWFGRDRPSLASTGFSADGTKITVAEDKAVLLYDAAPVFAQKGKKPAAQMSVPAGCVIEARVVAGKSDYRLDLGGKSPDELVAAINSDRPPKQPQVKVDLVLRNVGKDPIKLRLEHHPIFHLIGDGPINVPWSRNFSHEDEPMQTAGPFGDKKDNQPEYRKEVILRPGASRTISFQELDRCYWVLPGRYELHASCLLSISPAGKGGALKENEPKFFNVWARPAGITVVGERK